MRDDDAALLCRRIDIPRKVLLDRYGKARVERSLNAVIPLSLIRVAVMRIQNRLVVIQKVQIRVLRKRRAGGKSEGGYENAT